jgi:hypothetical protein
MTTGLKLCSKCSQLKPMADYHKAKRGKDGLRADCKACHLIPHEKEMLSDGLKRCVVCKEIKELHCFPVRKTTKDGRRGDCIVCHQKSAKNYFLRNKERFKQYRSLWLHKNPKKAATASAKWAKNNRPKLNARDSQRRASEVKATPSWLSAIQKAQIQETYDVALAKTVQTGIVYEVDHIHPLKGDGLSGLHVPWNLQVISRLENRSKGNKLRQQQ